MAQTQTAAWKNTSLVRNCGICFARQMPNQGAAAVEVSIFSLVKQSALHSVFLVVMQYVSFIFLHSSILFHVNQPFNHSVSQLPSESATVHLFFHSVLTHTHAGHIRGGKLPNTLHGACRSKSKHVCCHLHVRQEGIAGCFFASLG